MKAICYLKQLEKLDAIIENKQIEKAQFMDIALSITGHSDGERVQSSRSKQRMADAVDRWIQIESEIDSLIDKLVDTKREIIKTIEQLNAKEYDLLHKVYIQRMTFKEVAAAKGKSVSWATTVHGRALQSLQKILDRREL